MCVDIRSKNNLSGGIKRHWGLSTTAIFGDLGGYVFENFRDTLNDLGKQSYMTICYPTPIVGRQMIAK